MTTLALLRHGPTAWSRSGRLQGLRDEPLDPKGRKLVATWRVPAELNGFDWICSPLARARETAHLLGVKAKPEALLAEMDWGDWEGRRLAEIAEAEGDALEVREALGLDFRAPGGESPREVQARVLPLLAQIANEGRPVAAVCHKGVIRAVMALACDWTMVGKAPVKLSWTAAHLFRLDPNGRPRLDRPNISLETP